MDKTIDPFQVRLPGSITYLITLALRWAEFIQVILQIPPSWDVLVNHSLTYSVNPLKRLQHILNDTEQILLNIKDLLDLQSDANDLEEEIHLGNLLARALGRKSGPERFFQPDEIPEQFTKIFEEKKEKMEETSDKIHKMDFHIANRLFFCNFDGCVSVDGFESLPLLKSHYEDAHVVAKNYDEVKEDLDMEEDLDELFAEVDAWESDGDDRTVGWVRKSPIVKT